MPLVYIVEDDANIREIESFALKTAVLQLRHSRAQRIFIMGFLKGRRIWYFLILCCRMRMGL